MTDAPKVVANETQEPIISKDKKPEAVGPAAAVTPVAEPAVVAK